MEVLDSKRPDTGSHKPRRSHRGARGGPAGSTWRAGGQVANTVSSGSGGGACVGLSSPAPCASASAPVTGLSALPRGCPAGRRPEEKEALEAPPQRPRTHSRPLRGPASHAGQPAPWSPRPGPGGWEPSPTLRRHCARPAQTRGPGSAALCWAKREAQPPAGPVSLPGPGTETWEARGGNVGAQPGLGREGPRGASRRKGMTLCHWPLNSTDLNCSGPLLYAP